MLDLKSAKKADFVTTVHPSDNIFVELGKNTYNYLDIISELIDNTIASRNEGQLLEVDVVIRVDKSGAPTEFIIKDNAKGISQADLGRAISPAGVTQRNSLNEHGLGMKQAIAALGKLKYLATKTSGEQTARFITQLKFGDIDTFLIPFDQESGTIIAVEEISPIVITNSTDITRRIVRYLGARYRRFLKPDNRVMNLIIRLESFEKGTNLYRKEIEEVKPVYFHPSTRKNSPVMLRFPLEGKGWKAALTFGYAPAEEAEYDELGIEKPTKFEPYNVSLSRQGLDIILHDRVILFHQLSEINIVSARHNMWNTIRGEIELIDGFSTAITKNSIIADENFIECIDQIKGILEGNIEGPKGEKRNFLQSKTYPEQLPESLLRDRLAIWLKDNPLNKKEDVKKEYVVAGIEGYIDILADKEAWEIKVEKANALDVYQLFMYLDVGDISKGYLLANDFTTGARCAADHIIKNHGKELELANLDKFPITHPPTLQEREDYF